MTDPGLNQRLRQRSRRAGFMIGVSMALTIAVCVGGFSFLYAALDGTFADFISEEVPTAVVPTDTPTEEPAEEAAQTGDEATEPPAEEGATEPPAEEENATEESPSDTGDFVPDYQVISSVNSLNFRSEPSVSGGGDTVITTIVAGTPLMFLDERRESENSELDGDGGEGWMQFRLEDGTEGWLRAIDVEELDADGD